MSNVFFTSDLHIGHNKDFLWKKRGFSSIEQHDTAILKNWNRVVEEDDIVYMLGDLFLGGNKAEFDRVFSQLNGTKFLIRGNHDSANKLMFYNGYDIKYLGMADLFTYEKKIFYLSHYPTFTENFDDRKRPPIINLYGHTHQEDTNFFNGNPYMYHVGLDSHNMTPVNIDEIINDIKKQKERIQVSYNET